jgi:hypothetical protein
MSHCRVNPLASWPKTTTMLAWDFFTMNTILLKQLCMLYFIELDTRKVYVTGVTEHSTGARVVQQA